MKDGIKIPTHECTLIHELKSTADTSFLKNDYEEIILKGPHTITFNLSGDTDYIKILTNFDVIEQCATETLPNSGLTIIEADRQGQTPILIDPSTTEFSTSFFPDEYAYKKTFYPGLTTVDKDFNTVVHSLSVTIAQPSYNEFVGGTNLLDVRTFTNIKDEPGKAVILLEDISNQWVVPVTLIGERTYTSTIQLGDTLYGQIKFNVCLQRAPYANTRPDGTESSTLTFAPSTVFLGNTIWDAYSAEGYPGGVVRDYFTLVNTGEYTLEVTKLTGPYTPFYIDSEELLGEYAPGDSVCESSKSAFIYFEPENILSDADAAGAGYVKTWVDTINIINDSTNKPSLDVDIVGRAKAGFLTIADTTLAFEDTLLGETSVEPVQLVNNGSCPVKIFDIEVDGAPYGSYPSTAEIVPENITFPFIMLPGETRVINARFTPVDYNLSAEVTGGPSGVKVDKASTWTVRSNAYNDITAVASLAGAAYTTTTTTTTTTSTTTTTTTQTNTTTTTTSTTTTTTTTSTTSTTTSTCPAIPDELYVRWQYTPVYVVEGEQAILKIVRDPQSTYAGAFKVDYNVSPGNAISVEDYVDPGTRTVEFPSGVDSMEIVISTNFTGGIQIDGTNISISKFEGTEVFYVNLENARAVDNYGNESYPSSCVPEYFITDQHPNGEPSSNSPAVSIPVAILDAVATGTVTTVSVPGGGESCTFEDIYTSLDCDTRILTVTTVIGATEIVKLWNRNTGELIGVVPRTATGHILPYNIDVSGQFISSGAELAIIYESCGCCIEKQYNCPTVSTTTTTTTTTTTATTTTTTPPCSITAINGSIECCSITAINGSIECCSITAINGSIECCSITAINGSIECYII